MRKKRELGKGIDLKISKRYWRFNRDASIRDAFDALVELITNADDSYHRLFTKQKIKKDGGRILIEVLQKRGTKQSLIIVRDRAEGMTLSDMETKLSDVGTKRSEDGDRGFMARGAKDCTALGNVVYESIVDDKYFKAEITQDAQFVPLIDKQSVDKKKREELHIERGNGTVVTIKMSKEHRLPKQHTIMKNLPLHYSLRDILDENGTSEILIRNYGKKEKTTKIVYRYPEGELVYNKKHNIPSYNNAEFSLKIWKSHIALDDSSEKFRRSGLLIKSTRAVHECSLLHPSFEKDEYAKHYFGRIECPYIDKLLKEYDEKEVNIDNPSLLIDPSRQNGIIRSHPFSKALLDIPTKILKTLIDKDRSASEDNKKNISNKETEAKLKELAKAASKFFKQQIEDFEEISSDDEIDDEMFAKKGVLIYPTYANIILNKVRTFGLYVNKNLFNKDIVDVTINADSNAISILDKKISLKKHKKKDDLLYCRFRVKGLYLQEGICVEANCEGLPRAEALFSVIEDKIEEHDFLNSFEFEHKNYKLKEGSSKTIRLYAKYPEVVNQETEIKVISDDNTSLPIRGTCRLVPIAETNFARAEIKIESRRLVHKPIKLTALLNGFMAETKVKIVQSEEIGPDIKIELCDEDFGNNRAYWAEREGKPNLLKISAKHPSIKRYLGPAPEYKGQNDIIFKTILAEIVSESVCRGILQKETKKHSWKYNWADQKEDSIILQNVFYAFFQKMRDFLPIAHMIMVKDNDIKQHTNS